MAACFSHYALQSIDPVEVGRCPVVLCRKNQEEGGKGFSRSEGVGERATGLGGDYH